MDLDDVDLDQKYGILRKPEKIDEWEDRPPDSLMRLDASIAAQLAALAEFGNGRLLKSALKAITFIWAVDGNGAFWIAVEELALSRPDALFTGYPRRRGYRHPSEQRKLGHPTLLHGGPARIAGELVLDEIDGRIIWVINANSGRYCQEQPPNEEQLRSVARMLESHGLQIEVDLA